MRGTTIVTAALLAVISAAATAPTYAQPVPATNGVAASYPGTVPTPLAGCFQLLNDQMPATDIARLRAGGITLADEQRMQKVVRRACIEPAGSALVNYFRSRGIDYPEDISDIVVTAYGRWLRPERMLLDQMINARREHRRFLAWREKQPITTVSSTDLTMPFHTPGNWQFVIRQDPPQEAGPGTVPGDLHFCFVNGGARRCFDSPLNILDSSRIVYPTPTSREPLLVVSLADGVSVTGGGRSTLIWAYNSNSGQFEQVLDQIVNRNTNGEIRLITSGPLAGDVVIDRPGPRPAYRYHIDVYRLTDSTSTTILSYYGNSRYNDGSGLPVIDAEMAEIERRLHLWKPGDPLPSPTRTRCDKLELRHGVEWCG